MMRIAHVLDAEVGWEQRLGMEHLLDRLPGERFAQHLFDVEPGRKSRAAGFNPRGDPRETALYESAEGRRASTIIERIPAIARLAPFTGALLGRRIRSRRIDIVHAWGTYAATAARSVHDRPVVLTLYDPRVAARKVKLLRTLAKSPGFAVSCSTETVRRRLIEGGFPPEQSAVIRPGVDFGLINKIRRGDLRRRLGVGEDEFLCLVPAPVTRESGAFEAVYAVALRRRLCGGHRVIVPGESWESERIVRFQRGLPITSPIVVAPRGVPFEQLLAVADALLITPRGDISTTAIAWAMAAGAGVIGTAVYAVAEIIAHGVNGLLFKQTPGRSMSGAIYRLLEQRDRLGKTREAARGQAYEVFGLRRYAEQMMRLYENVKAGRAAAEGIPDAAMGA